MNSIVDKINSLIPRAVKEGSLNKSLIQAYNGSREWGAQKKLCYAPFSSLFISSLGLVRPCYANRMNVQYPDKGLSEIWFGTQFNNLRKKIDRNDLSGDCEFCDSCIKSNDFGSLLAKKYDNPQFHNDISPSKSNKIYPRIIEFELDNTCNLECIMCDGNLSSAIRKNREKRPPLLRIYDDSFLKQLKTFIPHLKVAEFAGGAPFLIHIYYKIWDMILEVNPKCEILITTSANTLNDKIKKLIARGRFNFNISIDSLQKENYEKIRVNGNFERVMENILFYRKYCEEKTTSLCILVCPLRQNWRELPDFIRFADKLGVRVNFHVVFKPYHHALWSLPHGKLYEIYEYLSGFDPASGGTENTAVNKINKINYMNLVKQINIWYKKAVIREKEEEAKEQVLARKIESAKNLFYENLRNYIFIKNDISDKDKEEKILHIKTQINTIFNGLPDTVSPEIVFTELAKYSINEVVYSIEHYSGGELLKKAKDIYNNLYSGLRDGVFSYKYVNDNEKYRLNMQY